MRIRYVGIRDAGVLRLTVDEFLQFGSKVRAVLVCEEMVSFFDYRQRPIPIRDALGELRETWHVDEDLESQRQTRPPGERAEALRRKAEHDERRLHFRHDVVVPVSVATPVADDVGFTENISEGGLLFRSSVPYARGDHVRVKVPLAGVARGIVVRSVPHAANEHVTAVAFVATLADAA